MNEEKDGVQDDGTEGDDKDSDQRVGRGVASVVLEGTDEHVGNGDDDGHTNGTNNFGNENVPPSCSGLVAGKLLRRVSEAVLLVTSDHRSRQAAVSDPRVAMRPRVTTRHPSKEFTVVDHKVGERELMRVEQERCDDERHNADPEVDEMGHPDCHRDVDEHQERPHAKINAGAGESRVQDAE